MSPTPEEVKAQLIETGIVHDVVRRALAREAKRYPDLAEHDHQTKHTNTMTTDPAEGL